MRKRVLLLAGLLALLALGGKAAAPGTAITPELLAARAFTAAAAMPLELKINAWAQINDDYLSLEALESIGYRLAEGLDGAGRLGTPVRRVDGNLHGLAWNGQAEDGSRLELMVQSLDAVPGPGNNAAGSYVVINMARPGGSDLAGAWRTRLEEAVRLAGGRPRVSVYLTGTLSGRLTQQEMERLAISMLRQAGARPSESLSETDMVSLTGYHPGLAALYAGQQPVNLNVALRYHASEGLTYVEVGSPLLDGEY